jgi:mRNA interferase MazF
LKRGDLVTVAANLPYTGKPRPAVIVQSDAFPIASVTVCLITSEETEPVEIRIPLQPDRESGLGQPSWIMVDKIMTVHRNQIGRIFGRLNADQVAGLDRALAIFLDLSAA